MRFDVVDKGAQALGEPLVFVVDQLLPDVSVNVAHVQVAELSFGDIGLGYKIGKVGDHITFGEKMRDDIGSPDFQNRGDVQ